MFILKFLFFIVAIGLFMVLFMLVAFGGTAAILLKRVLRMMKNQQTEGTSNYAHTSRNGQRSDENIIIDTRSADKQHRQIFADDEGEYVEYEEEA